MTKLLLPIYALTLGIIIANCNSQGATGTVAEKNKSIIERYIREMNNGNRDFLDEYLDSAYVYHGPQGDLDADEFRNLHNRMLMAFPRGNMEAEAILTSGDKVITRWRFRGNQTGELDGIPPSGKEVTVTGIIISRFVNGKAVEEWEEMDRLGMMQQLGIIPTPGLEDE